MRCAPFLLTALLFCPMACAQSDGWPEPEAAAPQKNHYDYAVDVQGNLYRIDVVGLSFKKLGQIKVPPKAGKNPVLETPTFSDLGATADGYLYGISDHALYRINLTDPSKSEKLGSHGLTGPWGMAAVGSSLLVNTSSGEVHLLDRKTGQASKLGAMQGPWRASGDIAFVDAKVLSSVKDAQRTEHLVELDPQTGKAKLVGKFVDGKGRPIDDVYGLIERGTTLYGLTAGGDIVRIDPKTARCKVLMRTRVQWWGATSYTRM